MNSYHTPNAIIEQTSYIWMNTGLWEKYPRSFFENLISDRNRYYPDIKNFLAGGEMETIRYMCAYNLQDVDEIRN